MISRIVLCAFPNRLTAGLWRFGRLVTCDSFKNDEAGLNAFRQFLQRHPSTPLFLIADAVEEDYRVESAPHTSGLARQSLLERKLGQIYRNSVYRAAQFIGRAVEQRRDDLFLLVALSNAESIHPWVLAMEEQRAPLAGVYLLPMVSQFLVDKLKLDTPHLLLMDGLLPGLRQTYFHNGRLRVSRLALETVNSQVRKPQLYMAETEKTRLYLLSQRLIAADTKLSLLVLTADQEGEAACQTIVKELEYECLALDARKLGSRVGLQEQALQQFPELLYMQVLAKGGVPVNLAPSQQTRDYRINRLRGWIGYASAGIFAAGILMAALNLRETFDFKEQLVQAQAQTHEYEHRYDEVARNFPATPIPGNELKVVVDMSAALETNNQTPLRVMQVVSTALDSAPEIQLQRLHWKLTNDLNVADDGNFPKTNGNLNGSNNQAPRPGTPDRMREIGFVDGEIRNFTGDYRAALNSVTRFADLLGKDPRIDSVVVVQQPVNVSSYSNLQGSTLDAQAQQMPAAQFKIKLVLKPAVAS